MTPDQDPGASTPDAVEGGLPEPTELEPAPGSLALALDGPAATRADWERAAAAVLRKARRLGEEPDESVWEQLTRRTLDGVGVSPLGTSDLAPGTGAGVRPSAPGGRDLRVELTGDGAGRAGAVNAEALADLDGGATSVWLHAGPDTDLAETLDGVLLDLAPVVLDPVGDPTTAARALLDHLGTTRPAAGTNLGCPADAADDVLVEIAHLALDHGVLGFVVDASAIHDRGGSDAQELGWSTAAAVRILRVLEAAGIEVEQAAGILEFRYAATDEQFPTIAKLRAARRMWSRVLELSGSRAVEQRQHAVTSRPMMSRYDPWVNMLRTTVAAFAATAGGADAVTVQPFDRPLGRPDAFGRRIARNQLHLLLDESHLGAVTDPAGGAWAVELLTDDIAAAGWDIFLGLEGGASLDEAIAAVVAERDRQVATRRRPITGLTEFPHLAETLPPREGEPDDVRRYGAAFEELRERPATSPVFLATMGPVAAHTARATYAANLLAAGGIAVESAGPTRDADDVLAAYHGQPVVCLAGPDPAYAAWGEDLVARLRAAGGRHVVVAGKAREWADDSCATGDDVLAFLRRTRGALS